LPVADAKVALLLIGQTSMELKNDNHGRRRQLNTIRVQQDNRDAMKIPTQLREASPVDGDWLVPQIGVGTDEDDELLNLLDELGNNYVYPESSGNKAFKAAKTSSTTAPTRKIIIILQAAKQ
jgi:hypothetical protein